MIPACHDHPAVGGAAKCRSCGRGMCAECFDYLVDGQPTCAPCAYDAASGRQRRMGYALTLLGLAGTGIWWIRAKLALGALAALGGLAAIIAIAIVATAPAGKDVTRRRELDEPEPPPEPALDPAQKAHPYRARAVHVATRIAPKVSASAVVLAVLTSLALAAVAFPTALNLPRWLEIELVLGAWWVIFTITLVTLLYRGFKLRDDFVYLPPWRRVGGKKSGGSSGASGIGNVSVDGCSAMDGEGCLVAIAIVVALIAFVGAAWVLAELALPLVFIAGYAIILRAIGRVARDRHECAGDFARSLFWGAVWSTIYLLPFAAIVVSVHYALPH